MYRFEVRGINPIPKERPRGSFHNKHHYTPERTRIYESSVKKLIKSALIEKGLNVGNLYDGKVGIIVNYIRKTRHPVDTDNLTKALKDALEGILWENDRNVAGDCAYISYDGNNPGFILTIFPFDEWLYYTRVEYYSGVVDHNKKLPSAIHILC